MTPPGLDERRDTALAKDSTQTTVSRLLAELRDGNDAAVGELFAVLYNELQEYAHRQRQRWRGDYTLDTKGLVHEAFLKLVGRDAIDVEDRSHFLALASRAMRHILCNYARDRRALKRGGVLERLPLEERAAQAVHANDDRDGIETIIALDDALKRLEQVDPRRARVVECRFFGGLTVEETATVIGVSVRTVKRDWAVAQAWLHREMTGAA